MLKERSRRYLHHLFGAVLVLLVIDGPGGVFGVTRRVHFLCLYFSRFCCCNLPESDQKISLLSSEKAEEAKYIILSNSIDDYQPSTNYWFVITIVTLKISKKNWAKIHARRRIIIINISSLRIFTVTSLIKKYTQP